MLTVSALSILRQGATVPTQATVTVSTYLSTVGRSTAQAAPVSEAEDSRRKGDALQPFDPNCPYNVGIVAADTLELPIAYVFEHQNVRYIRRK